MERTALLEVLADRITGILHPHPIRVAVDGVDGVGKTTLADELVDPIQRRGLPVIRASIDGFHHPRSVRYRRGRSSPEGYFRDSFNYDALTSCLLHPLGTGGSLCYRRAVFNYATDSEVEIPAEQAPPNSFLAGVYRSLLGVSAVEDSLIVNLDLPGGEGRQPRGHGERRVAGHFIDYARTQRDYPPT